MEIVVINGYPRSGKDTFVEYCVDILGKRCVNLSTIDFVKEIARSCGWDSTKTPENREFLSNLKDLLINWNDVPYKDIKKKIDLFKLSLFYNDISEDKGVVFIHCREPKEITKFVERMNAKTLFIRRAAVQGNDQSNHSDAEVANYEYDYYIDNDGTLEELKGKCVGFLKEIKML